MRYLAFIILSLLLYSCTPAAPTTEEEVGENAAVVDSAAWVVQQAIARHGGPLLDSSTVQFVFRDRQYHAKRQGGQFVYERNYSNEEGQKIADRMTNTTFERKLNGAVQELDEKQRSSYSNSLNSVMYFAFLPYFLQDEAVQLEYHGMTHFGSQPHYELKVTFAEDGGGKDFEDEYVYWFSAENFQLNFLAYNFLVNGGGARFREAYNTREVEGILFQDYINYKPSEDRRDVLNFDSLFTVGALDTLSRIELEAVQVGQ